MWQYRRRSTRYLSRIPKGGSPVHLYVTVLHRKLLRITLPCNSISVSLFIARAVSVNNVFRRHPLYYNKTRIHFYDFIPRENSKKAQHTKRTLPDKPYMLLWLLSKYRVAVERSSFSPL